MAGSNLQTPDFLLRAKVHHQRGAFDISFKSQCNSAEKGKPVLDVDNIALPSLMSQYIFIRHKMTHLPQRILQTCWDVFTLATVMRAHLKAPAFNVIHRQYVYIFFFTKKRHD